MLKQSAARAAWEPAQLVAMRNLRAWQVFRVAVVLALIALTAGMMALLFVKLDSRVSLPRGAGLDPGAPSWTFVLSSCSLVLEPSGAATGISLDLSLAEGVFDGNDTYAYVEDSASSGDCVLTVRHGGAVAQEIRVVSLSLGGSVAVRGTALSTLSVTGPWRGVELADVAVGDLSIDASAGYVVATGLVFGSAAVSTLAGDVSIVSPSSLVVVANVSGHVCLGGHGAIAYTLEPTTSAQSQAPANDTNSSEPAVVQIAAMGATIEGVGEFRTIAASVPDGELHIASDSGNQTGALRTLGVFLEDNSTQSSAESYDAWLNATQANEINDLMTPKDGAYVGTEVINFDVWGEGVPEDCVQWTWTTSSTFLQISPRFLRVVSLGLLSPATESYSLRLKPSWCPSFRPLNGTSATARRTAIFEIIRNKKGTVAFKPSGNADYYTFSSSSKGYQLKRVTWKTNALLLIVLKQSNAALLKGIAEGSGKEEEIIQTIQLENTIDVKPPTNFQRRRDAALKFAVKLSQEVIGSVGPYLVLLIICAPSILLAFLFEFGTSEIWLRITVVFMAGLFLIICSVEFFMHLVEGGTRSAAFTARYYYQIFLNRCVVVAIWLNLGCLLLVGTWMILGLIINPTRSMPYATAVGALVLHIAATAQRLGGWRQQVIGAFRGALDTALNIVPQGLRNTAAEQVASSKQDAVCDTQASSDQDAGDQPTQDEIVAEVLKDTQMAVDQADNVSKFGAQQRDLILSAIDVILGERNLLEALCDSLEGISEEVAKADDAAQDSMVTKCFRELSPRLGDERQFRFIANFVDLRRAFTYAHKVEVLQEVSFFLSTALRSKEFETHHQDWSVPIEDKSPVGIVQRRLDCIDVRRVFFDILSKLVLSRNFAVLISKCYWSDVDNCTSQFSILGYLITTWLCNSVSQTIRGNIEDSLDSIEDKDGSLGAFVATKLDILVGQDRMDRSPPLSLTATQVAKTQENVKSICSMSQISDDLPGPDEGRMRVAVQASAKVVELTLRNAIEEVSPSRDLCISFVEKAQIKGRIREKLFDLAVPSLKAELLEQVILIIGSFSKSHKINSDRAFHLWARLVNAGEIAQMVLSNEQSPEKDIKKRGTERDQATSTLRAFEKLLMDFVLGSIFPALWKAAAEMPAEQKDAKLRLSEPSLTFLESARLRNALLYQRLAFSDDYGGSLTEFCIINATIDSLQYCTQSLPPPLMLPLILESFKKGASAVSIIRVLADLCDPQVLSTTLTWNMAFVPLFIKEKVEQLPTLGDSQVAAAPSSDAMPPAGEEQEKVALLDVEESVLDEGTDEAVATSGMHSECLESLLRGLKDIVATYEKDLSALIYQHLKPSEASAADIAAGKQQTLSLNLIKLTEFQAAVTDNLLPSDIDAYKLLALNHFGRFLAEKVMPAVGSSVASLIPEIDDADAYSAIQQRALEMMQGLIIIIDRSPLQFLSVLLKAVVDRIKLDESVGHVVLTELVEHVIVKAGESLFAPDAVSQAYADLFDDQCNRSSLKSGLVAVVTSVTKNCWDLPYALFQTISRRLVNFRVMVQLRSVLSLMQTVLSTTGLQTPTFNGPAITTSIEQISTILGPECNMDYVLKHTLLPRLLRVFSETEFHDFDFKNIFFDRMRDALSAKLIPDLTENLPTVDELRSNVLSTMFENAFRPDGASSTSLDFIKDPLNSARKKLSTKGSFLMLITFMLERLQKQLTESSVVDINVGERFPTFAELIASWTTREHTIDYSAEENIEDFYRSCPAVAAVLEALTKGRTKSAKLARLDPLKQKTVAGVNAKSKLLRANRAIIREKQKEGVLPAPEAPSVSAVPPVSAAAIEIEAMEAAKARAAHIEKESSSPRPEETFTGMVEKATTNALEDLFFEHLLDSYYMEMQYSVFTISDQILTKLFAPLLVASREDIAEILSPVKGLSAQLQEILFAPLKPYSERFLLKELFPILHDLVIRCLSIDNPATQLLYMTMTDKAALPEQELTDAIRHVVERYVHEQECLPDISSFVMSFCNKRGEMTKNFADRLQRLAGDIILREDFYPAVVHLFSTIASSVIGARVGNIFKAGQTAIKNSAMTSVRRREGAKKELLAVAKQIDGWSVPYLKLVQNGVWGYMSAELAGTDGGEAFGRKFLSAALLKLFALSLIKAESRQPFTSRKDAEQYIQDLFAKMESALKKSTPSMDTNSRAAITAIAESLRGLADIKDEFHCVLETLGLSNKPRATECISAMSLRALLTGIFADFRDVIRRSDVGTLVQRELKDTVVPEAVLEMVIALIPWRELLCRVLSRMLLFLGNPQCYLEGVLNRIKDSSSEPTIERILKNTFAAAVVPFKNLEAFFRWGSVDVMKSLRAQNFANYFVNKISLQLSTTLPRALSSIPTDIVDQMQRHALTAMSEVIEASKLVLLRSSDKVLGDLLDEIHSVFLCSQDTWAMKLKAELVSELPAAQKAGIAKDMIIDMMKYISGEVLSMGNIVDEMLFASGKAAAETRVSEKEGLVYLINRLKVELNATEVSSAANQIVGSAAKLIPGRKTEARLHIKMALADSLLPSGDIIPADLTPQVLLDGIGGFVAESLLRNAGDYFHSDDLLDAVDAVSDKFPKDCLEQDAEDSTAFDDLFHLLADKLRGTKLDVLSRALGVADNVPRVNGKNYLSPLNRWDIITGKMMDRFALLIEEDADLSKALTGILKAYEDDAVDFGALVAKVKALLVEGIPSQQAVFSVVRGITEDYFAGWFLAAFFDDPVPAKTADKIQKLLRQRTKKQELAGQILKEMCRLFTPVAKSQVLKACMPMIQDLAKTHMRSAVRQFFREHVLPEVVSGIENLSEMSCLSLWDTIASDLEGTAMADVLAKIPVDDATVAKRVVVVDLLRSLASSVAYMLETDSEVFDQVMDKDEDEDGQPAVAQLFFSPGDLATPVLEVLLLNYSHFDTENFVAGAALSLYSQFFPTSPLRMTSEDRKTLDMESLTSSLSRDLTVAFDNKWSCIELCTKVSEKVFEANSMLPEASNVVDMAIQAINGQILSSYANHSRQSICEQLVNNAGLADIEFFQTLFETALNQSLERCVEIALAHTASLPSLIARILENCMNAMLTGDESAFMELQAVAAEVFNPDILVPETCRLFVSSVVQEIKLISEDDVPSSSRSMSIRTPRFLSPEDAKEFYEGLTTWMTSLCWDAATVVSTQELLSAATPEFAGPAQGAAKEKFSGTVLVQNLIGLLPHQTLRAHFGDPAKIEWLLGQVSKQVDVFLSKKCDADSVLKVKELQDLCEALFLTAFRAVIAHHKGGPGIALKLVHESWQYAGRTFQDKFSKSVASVIWTSTSIVQFKEVLSRVVFEDQIPNVLSGLVGLIDAAGASKLFISTCLEALQGVLCEQTFSVLGGTLADMQRAAMETVDCWASPMVQTFAAALRRPRFVRLPRDPMHRVGWFQQMKGVLETYDILAFNSKVDLLYEYYDFAAVVGAFVEGVLGYAFTPNQLVSSILCRPFAASLSTVREPLVRLQRELLESTGALWVVAKDMLRSLSDADSDKGAALFADSVHPWVSALMQVMLGWEPEDGKECDLILAYLSFPAFAQEVRGSVIRQLVENLLALKNRMELVRPYCVTRMLLWFEEVAWHVFKKLEALVDDSIWSATGRFEVHTELFNCIVHALVEPLLWYAFEDAPQKLWATLRRDAEAEGRSLDDAEAEGTALFVNRWCATTKEVDLYRTFVNSIVFKPLRLGVSVKSTLPSNITEAAKQVDDLLALLSPGTNPKPAAICNAVHAIMKSIRETANQDKAVVRYANSIMQIHNDLEKYLIEDHKSFEEALAEMRKVVALHFKDKEPPFVLSKLSSPPTKPRVLYKDLMIALILFPIETAFDPLKSTPSRLMAFLKHATPFLRSLSNHWNELVSRLICHTLPRGGKFSVQMQPQNVASFFHGLLFTGDKAAFRTLLSPGLLSGTSRFMHWNRVGDDGAEDAQTTIAKAWLSGPLSELRAYLPANSAQLFALFEKPVSELRGAVATAGRFLGSASLEGMAETRQGLSALLAASAAQEGQRWRNTASVFFGDVLGKLAADPERSLPSILELCIVDVDLAAPHVVEEVLCRTVAHSMRPDEVIETLRAMADSPDAVAADARRALVDWPVSNADALTTRAVRGMQALSGALNYGCLEHTLGKAHDIVHSVLIRSQDTVKGLDAFLGKGAKVVQAGVRLLGEIEKQLNDMFFYICEQVHARVKEQFQKLSRPDSEVQDLCAECTRDYMRSQVKSVFGVTKAQLALYLFLSLLLLVFLFAFIFLGIQLFRGGDILKAVINTLLVAVVAFLTNFSQGKSGGKMFQDISPKVKKFMVITFQQLLGLTLVDDVSEVVMMRLLQDETAVTDLSLQLKPTKITD
eukprot:m51a1_g5249 hypothetical protein (4366) ;mRNA; r:32829-49231